MHQPSGDNIFTDDKGDSWFQDGPPASTLKAADLNALTHELLNVLKAYGITPKNSGNDTYDQIAGALLARDQGKTREASLVIASSDSDENARLTADVVISTNEDFVPILNAQILALSNSGGGKIFFRKGNYNQHSNADHDVLMQDNVALQGETRESVVFMWESTSPGGTIIGTGKSGISISDLSIKGYASYIFRFENDGCYCSRVLIDTIVTSIGFVYCNNLYDCIAKNMSVGFKACNNLVNCSCDSIIDFGFQVCKTLVSCKAENMASTEDGFIECKWLSSCTAISCGNGFTLCVNLSSCRAEDNEIGFDRCEGVINCYAYKNTVAGYKGCTACMGTYALSHASALASFISCSPNYTIGGSAIANTTLGGCNHYIL
jgi:hypothetical protein